MNCSDDQCCGDKQFGSALASGSLSTCPALLEHFENVNNDLFIHLFHYSLKVLILLNEVRHAWVFGSLWALLEI